MRQIVGNSFTNRTRKFRLLCSSAVIIICILGRPTHDGARSDLDTKTKNTRISTPLNQSTVQNVDHLGVNDGAILVQ